VAAAEKWDSVYLNGTTHSVELYEHPQDVEEIIQEFLSKRNRGAFKLTNPFSKQIWLRELIGAAFDCDARKKGLVNLGEGLKNGLLACALVTFTDESWACPDTHIEFDVERAKQKVRNALNGLSFIASFEAAYYINETWEQDGNRGKLVCFHCHAVVWATNRTQLSRRRTEIKPRFRPLLGNKTGVRFDALKNADDVCSAIRYQAKMPALGYRTVRGDKGKKTQKSAKLSYLSRYRLFKALQPHDLLEFWLGGGEGAGVLSKARKKLNEHRHRRTLGFAQKCYHRRHCLNRKSPR
jgi:hypothetical protein